MTVICVRFLDTYISHSEQTSRRYYEFADTKDTTDAHRKIRQHQYIIGSSTSDSDTSTEENSEHVTKVTMLQQYINFD